MSYVSQGLIGLIIGIITVFFLFGILLIIFSIIMLALGLSQIRPGTNPSRCGTWGHDWRPQLPGFPSGTTCRNCLVRKDGGLLASRAPPPVPHVLDAFSGLFIPLNATHHMRKRPPREYILVDDPRMPHIPIVPGAPLQLPPPPPMLVAQEAGGAAPHDPRAPPGA